MGGRGAGGGLHQPRRRLDPPPRRPGDLCREDGEPVMDIEYGRTHVHAASAREIDDELWSAIGDPTRRRVLDMLLTDGPGTASSLSRKLPVTRQAVAKHLAVL